MPSTASRADIPNRNGDDLIGGDVHRRSYPVLKPNGHIVCLIAVPFENRAAEFGVRVTTPPINDHRKALDCVAGLAARGVLRPQICARLELAQAAEAQCRLEQGLVTRGRIILQIPPAGPAA